MKFSPTNIGLLVAGFIVLVGLGVYFSGSLGAKEQAPLSELDSIPPLESQFLELTSQLEQIDFDTVIFSNPRFMALVDITVPITPEDAGRPDPFAPL